MNRKHFFFISLLTSLVLLTFGCDEAKQGDPGIEITVKSEAYLLESIELSATPKERLSDFQWSLAYESGRSVDSCDAYNVPVIHCTFDEGGEVTITLKGDTIHREKIDINKKVKVLDQDYPVNQAPVILLALKSESNEGAVVSTLHYKESGVIAFPVNEKVDLDFSGTTDDNSTVDELSYQIDFGSGFKKVEKIDSHTFTEVGQKVIKVKVSDPDSHTAEKTFMAFISCSDEENKLAVDASKIKITADDVHNFFTYDATGAATAGENAKFKYRWDFNGDNIFDSDWLEAASIYEYTIFRGLRNVKLKVWETTCHNVAQVNLGDLEPARYNFQIPMADGVPKTLQGPQIPGYYFIQGHVAGLEEFKSNNTNADVVVTKIMTASKEEQWRVECDYRKDREDLSKATFTIKGQNRYERSGEDGELHGFLLKVRDINDPMNDKMSGGDSVSFENAGGTLDKAYYYTDEGYDKVSNVIYSRDGDCDINLVLTAVPNEGTCADGTPDFEYAITIDGTYSCPKMKGTNKKFVEIKKGAFYCEVSKVDGCIGGGGGGGGGQPPVEE